MVDLSSAPVEACMGDEMHDHLLQRIRELENKLEKEKSKNKIVSLDLRVSNKGAVSIYGLQRFPVTLYANQWKRILDHHEEIRRFIDSNHADLIIRPEGSN